MATSNSINLPYVAPVSRGGTGASSLTSNGVLIGHGTGAITSLGQATNGQLLIGSNGAAPSLATLTAGSNNVSITNGAGTISINAGIWTNTFSNSFTAVKSTSYVCNSGSTVSILLPASANLGDWFKVMASNGIFTITQNAGQVIRFNTQFTTSGVGGSFAANNNGCVAGFVYGTTNTWIVSDYVGTFTLV